MKVDWINMKVGKNQMSQNSNKFSRTNFNECEISGNNKRFDKHSSTIKLFFWRNFCRVSFFYFAP